MRIIFNDCFNLDYCLYFMILLQLQFLSSANFCLSIPIRLKWTLNLNALTSYDLNLSEKDHLVIKIFFI